MSWNSQATPVAFVSVTDRARALGFYCGQVGLSLRATDDFGDFLDMGGHGLLRMTVMPDHRAGPHPLFGWNVGDIETAVRSLVEQGVEFTRYEGLGQDALGIWTAPDGKAKVAWFADPDGNVLSLSQA